MRVIRRRSLVDVKHSSSGSFQPWVFALTRRPAADRGHDHERCLGEPAAQPAMAVSSHHRVVALHTIAHRSVVDHGADDEDNAVGEVWHAVRLREVTPDRFTHSKGHRA
jgi:hypothetical protein